MTPRVEPGVGCAPAEGEDVPTPGPEGSGKTPPLGSGQSPSRCPTAMFRLGILKWILSTFLSRPM